MALHGRGTTSLVMAFGLLAALVVPVVLAFGARLDWGGPVRDLIHGPLGVFTMIVVVFGLAIVSLVATQAGQQSREALVIVKSRDAPTVNENAFLTAVVLGYGWRTIVQVWIDRHKDLGSLIAGRREYAVLDAPARGKALRRRLRRAGLRWAALLTLPFMFLGAVYTVSTGILGPRVGLAVALLLPLLLWLASLLPVDTNAVRLSRASLMRQAQSPKLVGSQVKAWHAAFKRVAGPSVAGTGRPATMWTLALSQAAGLLFIILTTAYVGLNLIVVGAGALLYSATDFQQIQDRFERVRSAAALRMPSDPGVSSVESGRLVVRISGWNESDGGWSSERPTEASIADSPLRGSVLHPPYTLSIPNVIPASLSGLDGAERAYLAGFAGDPRFPWFERLARAHEYDPGAPERYPADMVYFERPHRDLDPISEVAYHKLAQAGLQVSSGDHASAEETLREIFSVGLLLAEGANDLDAAILGRNVATLGLDALEQLYRGLGRDAEAVAAAMGGGESRGAGLSGVEADQSPSRWSDWLERSQAMAADSTTVRALRFEILADVIPAFECANLEGFILGLSPELKALVLATRAELVRFPVDEAYFDMTTQTAARLYWRLSDARRDGPTESFDPENATSSRISRLVGRIFRNPRIISCIMMVR